MSSSTSCTFPEPLWQTWVWASLDPPPNSLTWRGRDKSHSQSGAEKAKSKSSAPQFLTSLPSSTGTGSCSGGGKTSCSVWRQSGRKIFCSRYCWTGTRGPTGPESEGGWETLPVYAGGVHSVEPHVQHLSGLGQLTVGVKEEQRETVDWCTYLRQHFSSGKGIYGNSKIKR